MLVEFRDILSKKFSKFVEDTAQLVLTHPIYGPMGELVFTITDIHIDQNNSSRCFIKWKNTSIRDHTCWFPYDLETSENVDSLMMVYPDYYEKVVPHIPKFTPNNNKRTFDKMDDPFANQDIIRQVNSLAYVYSHTRSRMDQFHHLALAILIGIVHHHPVKINTIDELQHLVHETFEEYDKVSFTFLANVAKHFIYIEGKSTTAQRDQKRLKTIHGVGDVRAAELVGLGIRNVDELRVMLTRNPKIVPANVSRVLPYHEDLQKRIPRREVETISSIVKAHGETLWRDLHMEVLGSYSRGALSCGDVDMLMTSPSVPSMNKDDYIERIRFLHRLVNSLKSTGVLVETMSMTQIPKSASPSVKGSVMFMGIVKVGETCRHIDIKIFPHDLLPFCQLHFVGNYRFSKALRWYTKQKGYRLSELGLRPLITPGSEEDSETDLEDGDIKPHRVDRIKTERDIFYALRMDYVSPEHRQLA